MIRPKELKKSAPAAQVSHLIPSPSHLCLAFVEIGVGKWEKNTKIIFPTMIKSMTRRRHGW